MENAVIVAGSDRQVRPQIVFLLAVCLLSTGALWVLSTNGYWSAPQRVAPALLIDLSLGLPALGYIVLVRRRVAGAWILLPLLGAGLLLSRWWIPVSHQQVPSASVALAVVELLVLVYLALRLRTIAAEVRAARRVGTPLGAALETAVANVLGPRVGGALFAEFAMLWYATLGFRSRPPLANTEFSTHRGRGYPAVLFAILLVVAIETAVAHLLLGLWNPAVAWLSTALGLYSGLWLLGDFNAARQNPIIATDKHLQVMLGLRWRVTVDWRDIVAVHDRTPEDHYLRMTLIGAPDLWIELREPTEVVGPLGIRKQARLLGIGVDAATELRSLVGRRIANRDVPSLSGDATA